MKYSIGLTLTENSNTIPFSAAVVLNKIISEAYFLCGLKRQCGLYGVVNKRFLFCGSSLKKVENHYFTAVSNNQGV